MLKISTGNSKTGPAFSIPEGITCPGKTDVCSKLCYVKTGRMNLPVAKNSRATQLKNVIDLIKSGKLAKDLTYAIQGSNSKTLRIHDSGDFMSPEYTRHWIKAVKACKDTKFWAYTRSFTVPAILAELVKLSKLKNAAIWISADKENWLKAVATYQTYPSFAGIAFMETLDAHEISQALTSMFPSKNVVIFPVHGHFGRLSHVPGGDVPNCPAITKSIPHDSKFPACLRCLKCLPQ